MEKKAVRIIVDRLAFFYRMLLPFFEPRRFAKAFGQYIFFFSDLYKYRLMEASEKTHITDIFPVLNEKTTIQPFDAHYFYQDIWAFEQVLKSKPKQHVDVGSRIDFVGFLTTITCVTYVDIRRLDTCLKNLEFCMGSLLSMPFDDNSIESLSCLHVAEHIGLGRYGDDLNPYGTKKACAELQRILKPGGNLYFSLPVGKPRLCFNAHRIHTVSQILEYFDRLELVKLGGIDDSKKYFSDVDIHFFDKAKYACGLFCFTKI